MYQRKVTKLKSEYQNIHQKIIDGCRRDDSKSQFQLYKLYYKAMYNTSLRIVKDPAEAEDIMQQSFLDAFDKIHTYSGKVSFGAWLKRIVINNSIDALNKKSQYISIDELEDDIEDNVEDTEEITLKVEEIRKAIESLPDGYRIVLSLYLLEGYDHEEIAQILKISHSTSRTQYIRAKKKLLQILQKSTTLPVYPMACGK